MNDAAPTGARRVFGGRIISVWLEPVRTADGREIALEIVRHPGSVVLLPMPDPDHVYLVRQYRHAVAQSMWELPAGSLDPGEEEEAAARRECTEEIGLAAAGAERLGTLHPTPGYCDERMTFFRLTGLTPPAAAARQDPDEQIEPRLFAVSDVRRMVREGAVTDMKTVAGLTLIQGVRS